VEALLNPAQSDAVGHTVGPLLILAGAGSGKTRVITYRIAELLRRGVKPWRILAVTFTNKAAQEMRHRITQLVGDEARDVWIGTFHATAARLLRQHAERVGLRRDFTIFDDGDQKTLVSRVLKDLDIADRFASPRAVLSAIDQAKNRGVTAEVYRGRDYFTDLVARVYPVYQERLRASNAVDFGDLLILALELARDGVARLAEKFDHVLVDEFQDTNRVQYDLVARLASKWNNLCVVGDDDQSIYRWRGADLRNILDFERDYPGAKVVKLEQNYRSTQVILDAANAVIARNLHRKQKRLFTEQAGGEPILYYTADDERREAEFIVRAIRKLEIDDGRSFDDFAIFYRTHAQSRVLEEALRAADLPYTVVGGTRFYDRAEVKDVLAYLRVIANPADEVSLERIINRPARGIGESTYEKIVEAARREGRSVWEAMERVSQPDCGTLATGARKKLAAFVALMDELRAMASSPHASLAELAETMLERTGYLERLAAEGTRESEDRRENLMELIGSMRDFEEAMRRELGPDGESAISPLSAYLERVSLVAPADDAGRGVSMMTVHAAKGLEFPVVFVTGLEDGVFPSLRDGEDPDVLEEERRLAYVAITRARERLFLTNAERRNLYGQGAQVFRESRFIHDIPEHLIARPVGARRRPVAGGLPPSLERPAARARPAYDDDAPPVMRAWGRPAARPEVRRVDRDEGVSVEYDADAGGAEAYDEGDDSGFRLGQRVRHPMFGEGEVRGVTGVGREVKLTVYFPQIGPKTIVARFVEVV
jgi:DNA helicase-2/ATP-dependent DNA helicase PcrA